MGLTPNPIFSDTTSGYLGAPLSIKNTTLSTTATLLISGLPDFVQDFVRIAIANNSTSGQILYVDDSGAVATNNSTPVYPGQTIIWTGDYTTEGYNGMPRKGISAVASAASGVYSIIAV